MARNTHDYWGAERGPESQEHAAKKVVPRVDNGVAPKPLRRVMTQADVDRLLPEANRRRVIADVLFLEELALQQSGPAVVTWNDPDFGEQKTSFDNRKIAEVFAHQRGGTVSP